MKKLIVLMCSVFFFAACNENTQSNETVDNIDTLENSEQFSGAYAGTTPCADCPGIYTVVEFSADQTYHENRKYLERDAEFLDNGKWEKVDSIITITYADTSGLEPRHFKVVDDSTIKMLDRDKQEVTTELAQYYILKRKDTSLIK